MGRESHCCSPLLDLSREDSLGKGSVNGKWEVSEDVAGQADISDTFCCRTGVDGKERNPTGHALTPYSLIFTASL